MNRKSERNASYPYKKHGEIMQILIALVLAMCATPVFAHEGTAGEHLILGLDAGLVVGTALGFASGVLATLFFTKGGRQSSDR